MKLISIPSVLVLGLAIAALVTGDALSQRSPANLQVNPWPPTPADIVNLSGHEVVRPGDLHVLYAVPSDAWLVVTDADRVSNPVAVGDFGVLEGGQFRRLLNATEFSEGYHSVTGLAFPPGSSVAVGNLHARTSVDAWWDVTGYLVR